MASNDRRPKLQGLSDDDTDRIRAYGLSRGFLPTELESPPPASPTPAPPTPQPSAVPHTPPTDTTPTSVMMRPAPTKPWQAMFPDYLIDDLRQAAAREGTAQKVLVLRALRAAGFRVDDIDLQDLRKR